MRKQFSAFAKRALAFTLALVLLLALVPVLPLTAEAAYDNEGWQYFGSYTWLEGRFHSDDSDLNFVDDQPYDWKVTIYQARTTANVTVSATVKPPACRCAPRSYCGPPPFPPAAVQPRPKSCP